MDSSQLLKGILEGCVLSVISRGETYGYEIITKLDEYGMEDIQQGSLYPVLTRLEKKGSIKCRKAPSPLGPIRKYYSLTPKGYEELQSFIQSYKKMTDIVDNIIELEDLK